MEIVREAASEFEERLWDIVDERVAALAPVYGPMLEGRLTRPKLAHWANQVYLYVRPFKRFLSAIHSNCDDPDAEAFIIENLWEEVGEGRPGRDHPAIMRRLPVALGVPPGEVDRLAPDPETQATIEYFHRLCRESWWVEALAAVGIGVEGSFLARPGREIPPAAIGLAPILRDKYGLSEEAVEFFALHGVDDVEHSRRAMEIVRRHTATPQERDRVTAAVRAAAERLTAWMRAVMEAALARS
jgi:pyrroloquinoline-quinone synthase